MPILQIRLDGPTKAITLPSTISKANFKLISYRVLFNRENHGYYQARLRCTLFNDGNVMGYTKAGDAIFKTNDLTLFLDPEEKLTHRELNDYNLGAVRNLSNMRFDIQMDNCIERKPYHRAYFDSPDANIQMLYGLSTQQSFFGTHIPFYPIPTSNQPDNRSVSPPSLESWGSTNSYKEDGTLITPDATNAPNGTIWVHTGVQVGNVDPQPGGVDYDERPVNQDERNYINNSGNTLKGSGYRKNAIIYAYSIDLVFLIE